MKRELEKLIAGGTIEEPIHNAESNLVSASGAQNELSARRFFEINETKPQAQVEFSEKNILSQMRKSVIFTAIPFENGLTVRCGRRILGLFTRH